jgi:hypothetical protein
MRPDDGTVTGDERYCRHRGETLFEEKPAHVGLNGLLQPHVGAEQDFAPFDREASQAPVEGQVRECAHDGVIEAA